MLADDNYYNNVGKRVAVLEIPKKEIMFNFYCRPPMKLREGNNFSSVCRSVHREWGWVCLVPSPFLGVSLVLGPFWGWVHQGVGIPEGWVYQVYLPPTWHSDGHQSERYTSYWNAFLFSNHFVAIPLKIQEEVSVYFSLERHVFFTWINLKPLGFLNPLWTKANLVST